MSSPRLVAWGAIGGIAGGALFVVGHLLALTVAATSDVANITGSWLVMLGLVATVFTAFGLHETLRGTGSPLVGPGTLLTVVGAVLVTAIATMGVAGAYGIGEEPLYLATEIAGVAAVGGGALGIGIVLLGIAMISDATAPTGAGGLFVAAAAAFLVGMLASPALYVGGILLGAALAWSGAAMWGGRPSEPGAP